MSLEWERAENQKSATGQPRKPPVEMHSVKSAFITQYGYEPHSGSLYLTIGGSGTHVYPGISQEAYEAFVKADSKGKYFHANLKGRTSRKLF